ncbi:MAG: hypothetical protein VYB72_01070 [Planctomycetota bacterium]|nr:hypothetical protein [Planctomycetota bacterium]
MLSEAQSPFESFFAGWRRWLTLHPFAFSLLLVFVASGCSSEESGESNELAAIPADADVPPADPTAESPGSMVMPANPTPTLSEAESASKVSGGLEMPDSPEKESTQESEKQSEQGVSIGSEKPIAVGYADWSSIRDTVSQTGKFTVVDLWSLACEPCLKEFPGLVQLQKDFQDEILCFSVNLDFDGRKTRPPESYEAEVVKFLQSVNASGIRSYVCTTASDDVFLEAKLLSIPVVMIFNSSGELVKQFVDGGETAGFSYAKDVKPALTELLGE